MEIIEFSDKMLIQLLNGRSNKDKSIYLPIEVQNIIRDYFLTNDYIITNIFNSIIPPIITKNNIINICYNIINIKCPSADEHNLSLIATAYLQTIDDIYIFNTREDFEIAIQFVDESNTIATFRTCIYYFHGVEWFNSYLNTLPFYEPDIQFEQEIEQEMNELYIIQNNHFRYYIDYYTEYNYEYYYDHYY